MSARLISIVLLAVLLGGCAAAPSKWPWTDSKNGTPVYPCAKAACQDGEVENAFAQAYQVCTAQIAAFGGENDDSRATKVWIAVVGTLAGTVGAPLAKGTGKTVWSGLSGSANAIQNAFDTAFSDAVTQKRINAISVAMTAGAATYALKTTPGDKVDAAMAMAAQCLAAPYAADLSALKAVVNDTSAQTAVKQAFAPLAIGRDGNGNSDTTKDLKLRATLKYLDSEQLIPSSSGSVPAPATSTH